MCTAIKLAISSIALAFLLAACRPQDPTRGNATATVSRSPLGAVPSERQRAGDVQKGYHALVNQPYITCGMPYKAYQKIASSPNSSQFLPGREGRNAELPYDRTYYEKTNGAELVTGNCLTCHAGVFNGKLVIGLGNENVDFTGDTSIRAESIGAYVSGDLEIAEWEKWADRIAATAPYTQADTVGVNPAIDLTWALIAHRDPETLAWSSEPLLPPPPKYVLPVSTPPWWGMAKKHAMFYTTAGRGDHARHMILGTVLCTDSVAEARAIDRYAPDIRAYIASLAAPDYPFEIDPRQAEQGRNIFEANCARCHGTYGAEWTYPNMVIAAEVVGTDPALAQAGDNKSEDRFIEWVNESFYGEMSRLAPAPGYIAPPLDGVWATAPYLHNGSVPTIKTLLDSSTRPKYWTRGFDSRDYNEKTLGWNFTTLSYGKEGARDKGERKRIYDTTLFGYSNQGHIYGDALTMEERLQVLEYLKTL